MNAKRKTVKSDVNEITKEILEVLHRYPHLDIVNCKVFFRVEDEDKHHYIRINP
jgi:septum formation topological specificity factor MinE